MHVWLDDIRAMPSNFTHHVKTAQDAIALIDTGKVETISLDHDLGNEDDVGSGYTVAKYIELCAYQDKIPPIRWMIHSSNPVGRKNMGHALDNAILFWAHHGYAIF